MVEKLSLDAELAAVVDVMPDVEINADAIANAALVQQDNIPSEPKRGRGRPAGGKNTPKKQLSTLGGAANKEQLTLEQDAVRRVKEREATAFFITSLMEQSGIGLAGDVGKMQEPEKKGITQCFDKYLEVKGMSDLPPSVALSLVMFQYYSRCLFAPAARPKVEGVFMWVRNKIRGFKDARSNRRDDNVRQNDASEKASGDAQK